MSFRKDFVWGAATAAYQVEGAWNTDGRGPSVWDQMVRWPGKVFQGHTGDTACDHYHHLEQDLDLMAAMGLKAYRFSFSWSRILPDGEGRVNEAGLAFYDRLIDGLLARGIQPWGTLFHWDFPLALYHQGGWLNAQSPRWFADYAALLGRRFGDRVRHWMTLNEPQIFMGLGHETGTHAPGVMLPKEDLLRASHHVLLAHGRAVQALREQCRETPSIGWAPAVFVSEVHPEFHADAGVVDAARRHQFDCSPASGFLLSPAFWCDPVLLGDYPEPMKADIDRALPAGWSRDLQTIATQIDFCGMNIYASWLGRHARDAGGQVVRIDSARLATGQPQTHIYWPVTPAALYWGPKFFAERYRVPIAITENGLSCMDWVDLDGAVHDPQRIDFTRRYLLELRRAAADGVDICAYFHWSLMDNFEWGEGYKHRFGLIHVDYETLKRTPKDSSRWYRAVIASNGAALDQPAASVLASS